jgi:hypothetical protein
MQKSLGRHNYRSSTLNRLISIVNSLMPQPSLTLDFAGTGILDSRITFTRSTTAKYYDSSTVALAEQNLFIQSNTFSNATWVKTGGTVATGVTDPAGGTTASSFTATALNATLYQTVTLTATPYTESIWIQRVTGVGVINLTLDGVTLSPVTITGSWVKYTYTATPSAGAKTVGIQVVTIGDVINIYGSQIENRSSATATNITTTAILQNYIPQLMTAAINAARFDYNPITRVALGLYEEQSSTNLCLYSQSFDNASWTKSNATITTGANIAPDGTQTAQLLVNNSANSTHYTYSNTITGFAILTSSIYVKAFGNITNLSFGHGPGLAATMSVNLTTGVYSVGSGSHGFTGSVTALPNGWYRLSVTNSITMAANIIGLNIFLANSSGSTTYTGDGYSGVFIWGAQLEALAFPTSYIPTTSAQVTRAADLPVLPIDTWYNTLQGTWFAQVNMPYTGGTPRIVGATPSSKAPIEISNQAAAMFDNVFGVSTANTITANTTQKIATAWTGTTGQVCLNGGTVATGNQTNGYANLSTIGIGYNSTSNDNFINGRIAKISYYPQALTSAQLQVLTGT